MSGLSSTSLIAQVLKIMLYCPNMLFKESFDMEFYTLISCAVCRRATITDKRKDKVTHSQKVHPTSEFILES